MEENNETQERNHSRTKLIIASIVALTILVVIGAVSYAYFTTIGESKNQEATINTARVSATFKDYGVSINKELNFDETITKSFTIENIGTVEAKVKMYWKDLINTYIKGSLTYTLSQAETEDGPYTEVISKMNVPQSESASTEVLAESLTIPVGVTYHYNLVVTLNYLPDVNQDADITAKFSSSFDLKDINYKEQPTSSASTLLAKANDESVTSYTAGNRQEMFVFDHNEAEQTTGWTEEELRDYRYIGSNPNNYITFNEETWRIIGVFTVETENGSKEQLIKIIRDESIGKLAWASSGSNEWSAASLKTLLNGDYYNQSESFSSTAAIKGLSPTARNQIANVKWYLGGTDTFGIGGPDYYNFERGETVYSGHTANIYQRIGLMYPSDYVYTYAKGVDDTCYTNGNDCLTDRGGNPSSGWLYSGVDEWAQSPNAVDGSAVFILFASGYISGVCNGGPCLTRAYLAYKIRPTLYLSSSTKITGGDGSRENPYTIE